MRALVLLTALAGCDRVAGFVTHDFGPPTYDLSCAGLVSEAHLPPAGLVILLEASSSMGDQKWQPVTAALDDFFADPASTGLAASLTWFPSGDVCNADSYAMPQVDLRLLPDLSLGAALAGVQPMGGSPTLPAVEGALRFAADQLAQAPQQQLAVVLITDGNPDTCDLTAGDVTMALAQSPVPTHVIGIGASLDPLAPDGGAGSAMVSIGNPDQTRLELRQLLDDIRTGVAPCSFPFPSVGMAVDYQSVNLGFRPSTGDGTTLWPYDPACAGFGWHYDADPPKAIVLCPQSCQAARADLNAALEVVFDCPTLH
jgi:hypothetical protein